jgi:hypothetical protein
MSLEAAASDLFVFLIPGERTSRHSIDVVKMPLD